MIKKAGKGQAGYISYERFRRIVRTVILFLIPFPLRKPKLIGKICVILCGILELVFVILACDAV